MGRIEFWATIKDSYRFVFSDLGRFFRVSGGWMLGPSLLVVVTAIVVSGIQKLTADPDTKRSFIVFVPLAVWGLLSFAGVVSFPVAWHRAVLNGEVPQPLKVFRFGSREFRYLGYYLAICFGCVLLTIVSEMSFGLILRLAMLHRAEAFAKYSRFVILLGPFFFLILIFATSRLWLIFPAIAIEEKGPLVRKSWQRGRGNALRLFFGSAFCALPVGIVLFAVALMIRSITHDSAALEILMFVMSIVVDFLTLALIASFLSFAYRQLAINTMDTT